MRRILGNAVSNIVSEVFLSVIDGAEGCTRVKGILHNSVQNFSSGKNVPMGKSKARVFLERGFNWHSQFFLLNLGERSDGSIFRLKHVGRKFSRDELEYYSLHLWYDVAKIPRKVSWC